MTSAQPVRINLGLLPDSLRRVDYYWHAAQLESRQEAIKNLVRISLSGRLPENHSKILEVMHIFASVYDNEERNRGESKEEKVHIGFSENEIFGIDAYKLVARMTTRSKAIRTLAFNALQDQFPEEHVSILAKLHSRPVRAALNKLRPQ